MEGGSAILVDSLVVRRGERVVLEGLTCAVSAGAITGLLGPSGCGKSTLMRAIVGVQIVQAGSVRVLGKPAGCRALRSEVGYVTQAPSVYADLSVRENLRYFARVLDADSARVEEVVGSVALGDYADQIVANLSEGQRSRVSLASALLGRPRVLVLDEPTVGLDPVLRRDLWATFATLAKAGTTLLISSHVMDEADHCDRLLLMRDGRLLASETPAELRAQTGERQLEDAFLALIEQGEAG